MLSCGSCATRPISAARACAAAADVVGTDGEAAEQSGLGHVGVDDIRLEVAQGLPQREERLEVVERSDRPAQRGHEREIRTRRRQVGHVALAAIETAVQQAGDVPAPFKIRRQGDRLDRRSADVQARDYAKDAHPTGGRSLYHFGAEGLPA